ncbi:hypothetical protein KBY77_16105 [Synechococcus sp. Cruz-7E5]|nr:hypothetical protein [Synechococcus sp. Edmonson 11F2]MCP9864639.1 hypothetical protein [Synechococcus sp. Cruz-7E5]
MGEGMLPWTGIADDLLTRLLEIEELLSIDASGYEGASLVHDLNQPVPESLWGQFDAVIDGGTLEHVFNFPTAIVSCMRMLKIGGRFYSLTPANNHCGHGFYQFSPELFFRLFHGANGFDLETLLLVEHPYPGIELSTRRGVWTVKDPAVAQSRGGLVNRHPVYLFVQAVKRQNVEPLALVPQQSDYKVAWNASTHVPSSEDVSLGESVARRLWQLHAALPPALGRTLLGLYQRFYRDTLRNRKHYRRWNPHEVS